MSDEPINERYEFDANVLHLTNEQGGFEVWLNTEVGDYDGLIVGLGDTRQEALMDASQTLSAVVLKLITVASSKQ